MEEQKIYTVYYGAYETGDPTSDPGIYPIFLSTDASRTVNFYKSQIKDVRQKEIIEETPTSIEYSPDEKWIYTYKIIELELEKDLRYGTTR